MTRKTRTNSTRASARHHSLIRPKAQRTRTYLNLIQKKAMGRPLYTSILLARNSAEVKQVEPLKPTYPVVEKWSRWNAFDPDSKEFLDSHDIVDERFLTEEEIAAHAQEQQRESARLLTERLLREADSSSPRSSITADSDHPRTPIIVGERISASRPTAVQMEVDVETVTEVGDAPLPAARHGLDARRVQEGGIPEGHPPRRQPRRAPAFSEWHLSSNGEISPAPVDVVVPRISVVPVAQDGIRTLSRSPSPDPLNLVSGLQYFSESPRPLVPVESPPRAISPIPNTPARVSGVFAIPPSVTRTVTTSPAPTMTPRLLAWGSHSEARWVPESPTPAPRVVSHYLGPRLSSTPAPLTY